jgi:hypothetical protein
MVTLPPSVSFMSVRACVHCPLCDSGVSPTLTSHTLACPSLRSACMRTSPSCHLTHPPLTSHLHRLCPSCPPHHHPVTPAHKYAHAPIPFVPSRLPTLASHPSRVHNDVVSPYPTGTMPNAHPPRAPPNVLSAQPTMARLTYPRSHVIVPVPITLSISTCVPICPQPPVVSCVSQTQPTPQHCQCHPRSQG